MLIKYFHFVAVEKKANNVDSDSDDDAYEAEKHKKSLLKLEETDPEFYKYLKQHDTQLLDFNLSDEGSDAEGDNDEDYDDMKHIPDDNLEVNNQFILSFLLII